jgi:hypothetical protein
MKDESSDLLADSHILNRWKNFFSQPLNLQRVSDDREIEVHTGEPLVAEPNPSEIDIVCSELENYNSLGNDHIPVEYIQVGDETIQSEIHQLTNSIWNKQE